MKGVAALVRLRREQAVRRRIPVEERLRRLLAHARARSPYYAQVDEGHVVTKSDLVDRFDSLVTDRSVRRADLPENPPRGYRAAMSSGSTGQPAVMAYNRQEWAALLAASASMRVLAGPPPGPRAVKIGSPSPFHLSAQLGATIQDPRRPTLRLPVTMPIDEMIAAVDGFRPDILTASPSMLGLLAGRLTVRPTQVFAGGDVLTPAVRRQVVDAWGSEPFDQYVTTEVGPVAGECPAHDGLHVLGDHVILEVVDGGVLVTALSSRTVPLIRYSLGDRVRLAEGPCGCGRTGMRIAVIEGRSRELLQLGGVAVHPTALTAVLDTLPVGGWSLDHDDRELRVLVREPRADFDPEAARVALVAALAAVGAQVVVVVSGGGR